MNGNPPGASSWSFTPRPRRAIDPVTFEVIKNNLWNINIEHGTTLIRTSGSLIVAHGRDLNPCILTEDVEYVFAGPYVQIITSAADLATRWVMDNLADNPGIREGDMFLSNDPWIGATHQMDVTLICPVFVEGRIVLLDREYHASE